MAWLTMDEIPSFLRIDAKKEVEIIVQRMTEFRDRELLMTGKEKMAIVLGLSGGLDSAVVCRLWTEVVGPENVYPVIMPGPTSNSDSDDLARLLAIRLQTPQANRVKLPISEADITHALGADLDSEGPGGLTRRGNVMARLRMLRLRDRVSQLAEEHPEVMFRLAGTENASEHWMAFFTISGDQSSDIEILTGYLKTQVWQLGKHFCLSPEILDRDPSPELGDCQTDEEALPSVYWQVDSVLFHLLRMGDDPADVRRMLREEKLRDLLELVHSPLHTFIQYDTAERILQWIIDHLGKLEIPYELTGDRLYHQS
ncbi:MAG: NAD(+) synthase [Patescibacteria group bacterium]